MAQTSENGQPWWVKGIMQVGVPAAIAIYLVYIMTNGIQADVRTARELMTIHHSYTMEVFQRLERSMADQTSILRATCVAQSRSAGTDERECVR